MKKLLRYLPLLFIALYLQSCGDKDDPAVYIPIPEQISPVVLNVTQVPYPKLSDYKFFLGDLKNLEPAYKVVPYKPTSELFSDYSHKKRFIWMPKGSSASYAGDDNVMNFPVGTVMIKNFYYNNVMPGNVTQIIETRLLIKVAEATTVGSVQDSGWKLYDYVWNPEQTEAYLDVEGNGIFVPITFSESGVERSITYKIPAATECFTCHKLNPTTTDGGEIVLPIGPKPQNLSSNYTYADGVKNQLDYWKSAGYIDASVPPPSQIDAVVDYKDTSKPLELRARSYMDINCAHCHRTGGHCDYVAIRFNFSNKNLNTVGLCMPPSALVENGPYVINGGDAEHSEIIQRMNTVEESLRMPIIGRTVIHDEGVQLMRDWINSIQQTCN